MGARAETGVSGGLGSATVSRCQTAWQLWGTRAGLPIKSHGRKTMHADPLPALFYLVECLCVKLCVLEGLAYVCRRVKGLVEGLCSRTSTATTQHPVNAHDTAADACGTLGLLSCWGVLLPAPPPQTTDCLQVLHGHAHTPVRVCAVCSNTKTAGPSPVRVPC